MEPDFSRSALISKYITKFSKPYKLLCGAVDCKG